MKLLVTTRADRNISDMTDITHRTIRGYAKKCGADFMVLDHETDCTHMEGKWHYRILKQYDLFEEYDRILHIDSDILITPSCPDLFKEVPYDMIGTIYEDKGSRQQNRRACIMKSQSVFGDIGWRRGYINTGVFLTSRIHRDIFQKINNRYYEDWGHDDVHLGYQIARHGFEVHELDFTWNHMVMFNEAWMGFPNRFNSHIIHYAGGGIFDSKYRNRLQQIKGDYSRLYGATPEIDWFFNCLENYIPFAFARFNDGEMMAMENPDSMISRGSQKSNRELSDTLRECIQYRQDNYFVGVPCSTCFGKHRELADHLVGCYDYKVLAVSNINRNYGYFVNHLFRFLKGKSIYWISGSNQDISFLSRNGISLRDHIMAPPKNAWSDIERLRTFKGVFEDGDIVLISLGPTGRVLVKEYFEYQPNATFIDIGSCFDPYTQNIYYRYHKKELPYCGECN